MMRAACLALSLVWLSGAAFASAAGTPEEEIDLINQAITASNANDCTAAVRLAAEAVNAPSFGLVSDQAQFMAERVMTRCAMRTDDFATAARFSRMTTASALANGYDWSSRLYAALNNSEPDDASLALMTLVEKWPDQLNNLPLRVICRVLESVEGKPEGDARNIRVLETLYRSNWQPQLDPGDWDDGGWRDALWLILARHDLKAGNVERARKLALAVTNSNAVIAIRADKLFDAIVANNPDRFDIAKTYDAAIGRNKAFAASHPDYLKPVITQARLLAQRDRADEALKLLDATVAKVKAGTKFKDADDQLNWLYNDRAGVLMDLGRVDESLAAMAAGAGLHEQGSSNVSQIINLAGSYCMHDRPQDGLKVLETLDPAHASAFGKMAAEEARICALAQIPGSPGLEKSLGYVRAHADDAPAVAIDALLDVGDEQGAVALALRFLADPAKREAVLSRLHTGITASRAAPLTAFAKRCDDGWESLRARPEVIAAVETFGHILKLPIVW